MSIKNIIERYSRYSDQELKTIEFGTMSMLAILAVPKKLILQASSKESTYKRKLMLRNEVPRRK